MATKAMQAIAISHFTTPSEYELMTLPRPTIGHRNDIIFKVHSASVNPIDLKRANGYSKLIIPGRFPYKIGLDAAGVVTEVGQNVTKLKVGDEVYVCLPENSRGAWAEYAKAPEDHVVRKPINITLNEASSLPLAAVTALQAFHRYPGSLEGKTVFIPGALSGTGAYACQLAKNVFKVAKVITTLSPNKIPKVAEFLGEGVVDQIIDYTKADPFKTIMPHSVDYAFDTMGQALAMLPIMRPKSGFIASISTYPSAKTLQERLRHDDPEISVPLPARVFLDVGDWYRRWRASKHGVGYEFVYLVPNGKHLEDITRWVEEGKIRAVIGTSVQMKDIEETKRALEVVHKGKGGIGKTIIDTNF